MSALHRQWRRPAGRVRLRRRQPASVLMPCGRCRQLLWEHGGAELLVDTPPGILPMSEVLPQAFGPEDLLAHGSRLMSSRPDAAACPAQGVAA